LDPNAALAESKKAMLVKLMDSLTAGKALLFPLAGGKKGEEPAESPV
jgi:hypothetical protein